MAALNAEVHPLDHYRPKRGVLNESTSRFAPGAEALEALKLLAMLADVSATKELDLSLLWRDLSQGACRVIDGFFSQDRCYLVLSRTSADPAPATTGRRLAIMEAVLSGIRQKAIAIDMDLAPSTVALNARLALEGMGVTCKPSRAHPLLMLAAKTSREPISIMAKCSTFVDPDGCVMTVVGVGRPDQFLTGLLPAAELQVIRSLVEGKSYAEIARLRGTSTRTVANQITAVFRRLRLSGRNELVQRLFFERRLESSPTAQAASETLVPPALRDAEARGALADARRSA